MHVPLPRRGRRGARSCSGSSGCRTGCRCGGCADTDLWYLVLELPEGSRVEYQIEVRRGEHYERFNDPLNPHAVPQPDGQLLGVLRVRLRDPEWTLPDPEARPGELIELASRARRSAATAR